VAKNDASNVKTLAVKANGNKENAVPDLENIIIENAAYWLKEHMIYLSHVESLNEVYIRLIGEKFSVIRFFIFFRPVLKRARRKRKLGFDPLSRGIIGNFHFFFRQVSNGLNVKIVTFKILM